MINTEVGNVVVNFSAHIHRWAAIGDVKEADKTVVTNRAHENAWRLTSDLIHVLEHAKESDMYWKLLYIAIDSKQLTREQIRLQAIAKSEDHGFMTKKRCLETILKEMLTLDNGDPDGCKALAKKAKLDKQQAAFRAGYEKIRLAAVQAIKADVRAARELAKKTSQETAAQALKKAASGASKKAAAKRPVAKA